ncbi:hypothetical protein RIF29_08039 [Crotalaria pallida]|uniref:Uncharacterized protein n=1 Tax=Crotalaria pallida TaxID=3830 RepID=A0AAN9J5Y7_CROPI
MAARSLTLLNRLAALLPQHHSFFPRGYAAAADVSVSKIGCGSGMVGSTKEKPVTEACSAWAPDPVTGYYRPINHTHEIDPVELRQMLLNNKLRSSSN